MIDGLMRKRNKKGNNLLYQCCSKIRDTKDDRYLIYLLKNVPNVEKYLYKLSKHGQFSVFQILSYFSTKKDNKLPDIQNSGAQRQQLHLDDHRSQGLLDALINVGFDFTKSSKFSFNGIKQVSTLELMLMVPIDMEIFDQVIEHVAVHQPQKYVDIMN